MARATRADVATLAGVSVATVSHVMNGRAEELGFSPATAERVRQAAAALGYVPRASARSFRYQAGKVIAMFYPDMSAAMRLPVFNELLTGAIDAADPSGYFILPVPLNSDDPRATVESTLREVELAGALCGVDPNMDSAADLLIKADVPVVWVSPGAIAESEHAGLPAGPRLGIDEASGMTAMLDSIAPATQPCALVGPGDCGSRLPTFLAHYPQARVIIADEWSSQEGRKAASALLDTPVDLIFAGNDYLALGVLCEMKHRAITPGQQVQLFGFGDTEIGPAQLVDMSSIQWPVSELGAKAAATVIERIAAKDEDPLTITLPAHAHPRSTTRPA